MKTETKRFFSHDEDIVALNNREDLQKYLDHIKKDDKIQVCYINECAALGMFNAPLLLPGFMEENKIDCDDQDAAECCEDYGIFLVFPTENKMETLPTRYTAFKSICARAGLSCVSMSNTEEKPNVKPLAPDRKAAIITECLKLYSDTAQILIRDGKVSAMHSKVYGWLMPYDIFEPFEHFAKLIWPGMEFSYGEVSHEYLYVDYYLHDELAEDSMKLLLEQFGAKIDGKLKTGIRVSTSDVAEAALRFSPFYEINGIRVRLGRPLEVIHNVKNTLEKVRQNVFPEIGMLLKESEDEVEKLGNIDINFPAGCLQHVVLEKHPVPYEETKAAMDEMTNDFPNGCKAIDVYLKLNEIAERKVSKNINTFGPAKTVKMFEDVAKLINCDYKSFDKPIAEK